MMLGAKRTVFISLRQRSFYFGGKILHFVQNDSLLVILNFSCEGSCFTRQ